MNVYAYCQHCGGFVAGYIDPDETWKSSQIAAGLKLEECEGRRIGRSCECGDDVTIYRLRAKVEETNRRVAELEIDVALSKTEVATLEAKVVSIRDELNRALARLEANEINDEDLEAASDIYNVLRK